MSRSDGATVASRDVGGGLVGAVSRGDATLGEDGCVGEAGGGDWDLESSCGDAGAGGGGEAGSSKRQARRVARLASSSRAAVEGSGAGAGGGELVGESEHMLGEEACCRVEWRIDWMKSPMEEGDWGTMVLRLWIGIGGAGSVGGRSGEEVVEAPEVVMQALEESAITCGGDGGGRSLRKLRMISCVDTVGLSSLGELDGGERRRSLRDFTGEGCTGANVVGEGGSGTGVEVGEGGSPLGGGREEEGEVVWGLAGDDFLGFLPSICARE